MTLIKNHLIAILLGCAYALLAVVIAGFGASISWPTQLMQSLSALSTPLAFGIADFVSILLPLAAVYLLLAMGSRRLLAGINATFYLWLLLPLLLLDLIMWTQAQTPLWPLLLRISVLGLCCYLMMRRHPTTKNEPAHSESVLG